MATDKSENKIFAGNVKEFDYQKQVGFDREDVCF